jgi:spore coat protein H
MGAPAPAAAPARPARATAGALPRTPAQLFQPTKVWTVHLRLSPEAWTAMEPKGGSFPPFGGGGGRPGDPPAVRPSPGGPGGLRAPRGFGPSMFLAPAFVGAGDTTGDGKLSAAEFRGLAESWFAAWDKERRGAVNPAQLREGLNASFTPTEPPAFSLQAPEGKRNGVAGMMGIEFEYVHADLEFEGQKIADVGLRYKGNGTFLESRATLKRSLKIELDRYQKGRKLAGLSTLNLHNNVTDASWTNEVLALSAFRDAGVPAPRTAYARVFVTVPGRFDRQYLGLYSLVENVDRTFLEQHVGTGEGALLKPSTQRLFEDLGDEWKPYNQPYEPKSKPTPAQERRIIDLCKLVSHTDDATFAARIGEFVDLDEFSRFMAVLVWITALDSVLDMGQNFYAHLDPRTNRLVFIAWDHDHSFGQFPVMGTQEDRENLDILHPWTGRKRFLDRMFRVEAFRKRYLASMKKISALFTPERFARQVDTLAAAIRPAVREESAAKLERFEKAVAGLPVPSSFGFGPPGGAPGGAPRPAAGGPPRGAPRPGGPGGPPPGGPGAGGAMPFPAFPPTQPVKAFVKARARSVADQLAGRSPGRRLSFGGPRGPGGNNGAFGPGMFLAPIFMQELDTDRNKEVSRGELVEGFARWFAAWNVDRSGLMTEDQLKDGIDTTLSPFRAMGGPPGGGGPPNAGGPPPSGR